MTPDPLGFEDGLNIYAFVHNNPLRYFDPDGQFVGAVFVAAPFVIEFFTISWGAASTVVISWVTVETVAVVGAAALVTSAVVSADKWVDEKCSKDDVEAGYAPDRPLPLDENGIHIPDTDSSHTQLGTTNGSKGKYRQGREFDKDGKPVKDIDFTDHGRPTNHANPHQHDWKDNPTGGSKIRGKQEPLDYWEYL